MNDPKTTEELEKEWWDDFTFWKPYAYHMRDASGREKSIWLPMIFVFAFISFFEGSFEIFFEGCLEGVLLSTVFLLQFQRWRSMFGIVVNLKEYNLLDNDLDKGKVMDSGEHSMPKLIREGDE
jgi:hypothetical protein|tara:strand:- start:507 stop:875 length:369 start_codon:yes stop_codon:yes gene_type:complete